MSLISKLRDDLIAQSLSVAVITPYKAQVRRLKQALQPFHDMPIKINNDKDRNKDRNKDRDSDRDRDGNRIKIKNDEKENERENEKENKYHLEKTKTIKTETPKNIKEEGEEDEEIKTQVLTEKEAEKAVEKSFDCEVNSIDGFQVSPSLHKCFHLSFWFCLHLNPCIEFFIYCINVYNHLHLDICIHALVFSY